MLIEVLLEAVSKNKLKEKSMAELTETKEYVTVLTIICN